MAEAERVLIVGGGVTGMQAAAVLGQMGIPSILVEKSDRLGGRVRRLSRTFPFFNEDGFTDGAEFVADIEREMRASSLVDVRLNTSVRSLAGESPKFCAALTDARMRSSRPSGMSSSGSCTRRRVDRSPPRIDEQRAHPETWRLTAALVTSSSSS